MAFHVVGEVGECVSLGFAAVVGDGFVAAGEAHRLERQDADFLRSIESELDDAAYLLVIDAVDNGHDGNDFDSRGVKVVDGLQFYVEQIADFAVCIRGVADSVELQVGITQPRFGGLLRKFKALRELYPTFLA